MALVRDGPLARIFVDERLRLAPAKGSLSYRMKDPTIFEQTYFGHALNVAVTAGLLFEHAERDAGSSLDEQTMRVVLAAGALHDFNKLNALSRGRGLSLALAESESEVVALLEGYIGTDRIQDVLALILDTESRTSTDAGRYGSTMPPRKATLAALCLQYADRMVGSRADPNDVTSYRSSIQDFRAKWPSLPVIRIKSLALLPQASLARAARQTFLDWIRKNGTLIHETESFVSWLGMEPTREQMAALDLELWSRIQPSPKVAFAKAGASHNSLRTTWAESVQPTPSTIDAWIEEFKGQLVVWQGSWGKDHFQELNAEFPGVFTYDKPPKDRVRVELSPPDEFGDNEFRQTRQRAKLVIAHCILQKLRDERSFPPGDHAPFQTSGVEGVMASTVPGILWARHEKDVQGAYDVVLGTISDLLASQYPDVDNPVKGFVARLLGQPASLPPVGSTGTSCIYCGAASARDVEEALVFGIKPTAWAPRKKGVQKESHRGKICELCVVENQLRDAAARDANATRSDSGYLTAHVHAADLVCGIKWEAITGLLQTQRSTSDKKLVLFPKNKRSDAGLEAREGIAVPLRGHVSLPIPKPKGTGSVSETLAYLWRLRECLGFVRHSGFKLHISPLALVPTQERAQFRWINPPNWMESLGLAEVHVDELLDDPGWSPARPRPSKESVVEAIIRAGNATGGSQGHRTFISHLMRDKLAVYDFPDAKPSSNGTAHFIETLEATFVPEDEQSHLTKAALAYIQFNARGEWTNNTWTWATRHYFELRDRYHGQPEWSSLVSGDLLAAAQRKSKGATPEKVDAFGAALEDYLATFRNGESPVGADQRVLINAIAYACKKNYRSVYPKEEIA